MDSDSRFLKKMLDKPIYIAGIVGFVGAATYGIIKIRQNPKMNFPLMMVQLRVGSQGMFAAILMVTVVGSLAKNLKETYWDKK